MKKQNILPLISVLALVGCDTGSWRRQDDLMARGWAEAPEAFNPPQLYCYKTLDKVECFREPLENEADRLEGYYAHNNRSPHPASQELGEGLEHSKTLVQKKGSTYLHHDSKKSKKHRGTQASIKATGKSSIKSSMKKESSGLRGNTKSEAINLKGEEQYQRRRYMTKLVQE